MRTTGTVRFWLDDEGWGVVDSLATPGGCWVHFSSLEMPGFKQLRAGTPVQFVYEELDQDGYPFRAVTVWPGVATAYAGSLTSSPDGPPAPVRVIRPGDLTSA